MSAYFSGLTSVECNIELSCVCLARLPTVEHAGYDGPLPVHSTHSGPQCTTQYVTDQRSIKGIATG